MKQSHKILTTSGIWLDYEKPNVEEISLVDIASGLSKASRWQNQTNYFYSVAEHSILGVSILKHTLKATPEEVLHFMLHDAHEAYTGDIGSPLKRMPGIYRAIKKIQHDLDLVIFNKFNIEFKERPIVKHMDLALLNWEWSVVREMPLNELPEHKEIRAVPVKIRQAVLKWAKSEFWSHQVARVKYVDNFIKVYNEYKQWKNLKD